jgi:hypothetical protein
VKFEKKRVAQAVILLALVGVFLLISRAWPKEQVVHLVLGTAAPRVEEVALRYGSPSPEETEIWTRQATFYYGGKGAPRIVTHEPRLPDGDYSVEIDLATKTDRNTVRRRVTLSGGTSSIDLSQAVPQ